MGNLNRKEFSKWLKNQVGNAYLWGGQGESLFGLLKNLANTNGQSKENTEKMIKYMESKGVKDIKFYDCSGLGLDYLMQKGVLNYDTTSSGLYNKCKKIDSVEVVEGDWGFLRDSSGKIYHIGYVVDNGNIVHAFNQSKGVILEKISKRNWIFGRPEFAFDFSDVNSDIVTLTTSIKGYNTAQNAINSKNPTVTYPSGKYYVYKRYGNATNISKKKGVAGAWVVL